MKRLLLVFTITALTQVFPQNGFAQDDSTRDDYGDSESVSPDNSGASEDLYKNEADTLIENKAEKVAPKEPKEEVYTQEVPAAQKFKSISELDKLTPFKDVAVIQKRFLPKSQRFEFNPNFGLVTNNAFFMTTYLQARMAYAFTEKLALELAVGFFMNEKYKVTEDLKDPPINVATRSLLLPEMYYGADIRWSPIYGKMGSFSEGIIPFDMYFSGGGGIIQTNQDTTPFAMHAGTGQIFAINKSMAFRWDLSMYFYSSTVKSADAVSADTTSQSFTDVQLSLGMSFFFPDAKYR